MAYLERHVTEQDKAMLELAEDLARLQKELLKLRERAPEGLTGAPGDEISDERPPHY